MAQSYESLIHGMARTLLAAVFIYAGANKALDPVQFAEAIDRYRVVPWPFAAGMALYLPWLEIVAGVATFWGRLRLGALGIIGGLAWVFVAAIASALVRGLDITCGCFGNGEGTSLAFSLVRSLVLAGLGTYLWYCEAKGLRRRITVTPRAGPEAHQA
jgi:putative oxidoreductase